jgi:xanthine dehydrogenase accessory factor
VVIVTRGHTHDRTVLEQALRTTAGYIGMLGSRKKSVEIRKALTTEGFSETDVNRFCCPIGLDIGAETVAEIAVSIVAELIRVRAGKGE